MLLSISAFAEQDNKNEATPKEQNTETKTLNIEASGTFEGATFTQNYIIIRCKGNEGCCFTVYDNELEIYSKSNSSSFQVSSVMHTSIQGDETIYTISR